MSSNNLEVPNSVWRPNVSMKNCADQQGLETMRHSLRHGISNDPVHQLNRTIIDATQSYNNTARPYTRPRTPPSVTTTTGSATQTAATSTTSLVSPPLQQKPALFGESQTRRQKECVLQELRTRTSDRLARTQPLDDSNKQSPATDELAMSPQLVHKQYNSPIDLYSMNNIRKTIEAHSEQLAPGVKGINFMKADSPINKQSEVYKLIKEEEERKQQQQQQHVHSIDGARSPLYGREQTQKVVASSGEQRSSDFRPVQYAAELNRTGSTLQAAPISAAQVFYRPATSNCATQQTNGSEDGPLAAADIDQLKCCECGHSIVGPFAKLQNRFIHPHCFNCSTCGTSLKNSGYFTINEKLYCEIHARQVANVMRLNYNFEPNKQTIDNTRQQYDEPVNRNDERHEATHAHSATLAGSRQCKQSNQMRTDTTVDASKHQHQHGNEHQNCIVTQCGLKHCDECLTVARKKSASTTTISTMFSSQRAASAAAATTECSGACNVCPCRRGEIKWSWRPSCSLGSGAGLDSSSACGQLPLVRANTESSRYETGRPVGLQTSVSLSGKPISETNLRSPVCCHCFIQIHGPYVMAGNLTWCKPCSQTHFICATCHRSLINVGFIEDGQTKNKYHCEHCYEAYMAPMCAKCHKRIKDQDCLKALGKFWHPTCFVCGHCKCLFGNETFYLEDNVPYCKRDWNLLFTTKCSNCSHAIEAGDKWIEALERNFHSDCFRCTACQVKLEGSTFYCKAGKPFCRMHAS